MGKLLAGAAKIRLTPPQSILDEMTANGSYTSFKGVYKDVYARCIALSNGTETFLIYSVELGSFPAQRRFRELVQQELGIHPDAVMLGNTHNHQCVNAGDDSEAPPKSGDQINAPKNPVLEEINERLIQFFHGRCLQAAKEAIAKMVPAKMGYASGESYINASRDWDTPIGGLQNSDYSGYSDRELVVMKVDSLDGDPIGMVVNFGVHSNMLYIYRFNDAFPLICGDIAGEIMEFVENASAGRYVCAWVEAAAGDQNPLMMGVSLGVQANPDGSFTRTQKNMSAESTIVLMEHLAQTQGLEILKTARKITAMTSDFELKHIRCEYPIPGIVNARTYFNLAFKGDDNTSGRTKFEVTPDEYAAMERIPTAPLVFKFHLAVLNGLAFCGINTEPYSYLGRIIKDVLPYPKAMVFAIDAGHLGYLPDVRKAEKLGFGTLDCHAETPWDVERAVYEGFRNLARELEKK